MPIKHAAVKALRKAQRATDINRSVKEAIRKMIKEGRKLVSAGKIDDARGLTQKLAQLVDKSAKRGTIKHNTAARIKSRFAASLKRSVTKAK